MRANAQDWITGLIWRKGLGTSRADISGSGRQSCEPEFNYIGCEAERQKLEKPRFARFFYFVVFRSHSLLDFLESRVMKRKSINHCQSRSEMERWTRTPEGTWNVLRTLEETHAISAILNSTTPGYEKKALKTIRLVLKSRNPYKKCTHNCYCECIFCLDSNF